MRPVASALQRRADGATGQTSVFGRIAVDEDFELLQRIERRRNLRLADARVLIVETVDLIIRVVGPAASDREGRPASFGLAVDTRHEVGQAAEVASAERDLGDLPRPDHFAAHAIVGIYQRRGRADLHRLGQRPHGKRHLQARHLVDLQGDSRLPRRPEPVLTHRHVVHARRQTRDRELPLPVRGGLAGVVGRLMHRPNGGMQDNRSGRIGDQSDERGVLGEGGPGGGKQDGPRQEKNRFRMHETSRPVVPNGTVPGTFTCS